MSFAYQKVQSVSKRIEVKGPKLRKKILETMRTISDIVGSTLGPGGMQVLLERQEQGLTPVTTKDGVTVYRTLGFDDPVAQCIMETARDASIRTASEAGDGTTTATILSEAIVRNVDKYCSEHPTVSPQAVVRRLESIFKHIIEPNIKKWSIKADFSTKKGRKLLYSVAKVSANGDEELANAVLECFDLVGDGGNVTLSELTGPSHYEVEQIQGYPVGIGYEDCCGRYWPQYINDQIAQRVYLEKPVFICYNGKLTEIQTAQLLLERIAAEWQNSEDGFRHNVVLVANGFSDSIIAQLGLNWVTPSSINVFPMLVPQSPVPNGQFGVLQDIASITGAKVLNPLTDTMDAAELGDLGIMCESFEVTRFRTNIIGEKNEDGTHPNDELVLKQVDQLELQAAQAASELDKSYLTERIGKLTGGIAKLKVVGASGGELREKRDRAEDAVCAVRGAIKYGCLPAGGHTLLRICSLLLNDTEMKSFDSSLCHQILVSVLESPFNRLLENCGKTSEEIKEIKGQIITSINKGEHSVYDALGNEFVDPIKNGILDSTPAVLEAIRNSLSIASLLGTLGGAVVFKRDSHVEHQEARDSAEWERNANHNPADERG